MSFGAAIAYCLKNYFTFSGRGRRSEFWWFYLFVQIVGMVVGTIAMFVWVVAVIPAINQVDPVTGVIPEDAAIDVGIATIILFGILFLFGLLFTIPVLAANARRLHDFDQSAHWLWFYLIGLGIVPVLMGISEGTPGPNRFGPDPKAAERAQWPAPPSAPAAPIV